MNDCNQKNIKIFLDGDTKSNVGPANVNKKIIQNSSSFSYVKSKSKIIRIIATIFYIIRSNVVLFSGLPKKSHLIISKIFRKKTIYFMHGYLKYDNDINNLNCSKKEIKNEDYIFKNVDTILCVSRNFMKWFTKKHKELEQKTYYVSLGIDIEEMAVNHSINVNNHLIIATGGNRNIKNNGIICDCIRELNSEYGCSLNLFGDIKPNNETIVSDSIVHVKGLVSQKQLYEELSKSKLFVLNTSVESFGLSVIDALLCGCNILIPENSGVLDIMNVNENDIIHNYKDKKEIKKKIIYNLKNNNNQRILQSIDFDSCSWKSVVRRITYICEQLYYGREYKNYNDREV